MNWSAIAFALLGFIMNAYAQNSSTTNAKGTYNEKSLRPIRKEDQMFRKALWFRMDLREKMNQSFFVPNNEFSKLLIDAVKKGIIQPYRNDSLETRMSLEEFLENLRIPDFQQDDELALEMSNEDVWGNKKKNKPKEQAEYFPRQIYIVEIREDLIFDRVRSRMYHDIQAITLIIPGEQTPTGLDKVLASFSYKELVENLFKPIDPNTGRRVENPNAIWFNPHNSAAHLNLADAFELRQFSAGLVKYENPKNKSIVDTYGSGKRGLIASEQALMKLIEYEALLWSY
ncbi:MAG: gliding motility protein GldN [Cytophagales bacterium]|nr:gliding motility protein GldN [Cytophagales bacterium]MDW8383152.1 gliding motility protein GldN [Flammeovirgaceae bacterium]